MTTATHADPILSSGTWAIDQVHSSAQFEVEHAGVSIFRGAFKPVEGRLVASDGELVLEGAVDVEAISVDDDNLRPHLLSPEFFDAERNPEIRFRSAAISGSPDDLRVVGELEMAGRSSTVEAGGVLRGPVPAPGGGEKVSLALRAVVDRTDFGMDWQIDIPGGGPVLANAVTLVVELELNRE